MDALQHTGLLVLHDHLQSHPFHTTILFWDCDCDAGYIHPLTEDECPVCHARRVSQPPARVNEIMRHAGILPRSLVNLVEEMLAYVGEEPIPF
jgi:hypothetical protein